MVYIVYKTILLLIPVGFGAYVFFSVFLTHYRNKRRLDNWSEFNQKLIEWAKEIQDTRVRMQYMDYATTFVMGGLDEALNSEYKIKEYRETIYTKFGSHIPSLKSELRNRKLEKLV